MKKLPTSILSIVAVVCLASYGLAITRLELRVIWAVSFAVLGYLACLVPNKYITPRTALFAALGGIILTHIPWWVSHRIQYGVSLCELAGNFFKGTKMFYSLAGIIAGYLLYKLTSRSVLKKETK